MSPPQSSLYGNSNWPLIRNNAWGPESAHQPQCHILGVVLPQFLSMALSSGSSLLLSVNSQLPVFLIRAPSEPHRFVSMDPTKLILGRVDIAPQQNISNLNA